MDSSYPKKGVLGSLIESLRVIQLMLFPSRANSAKLYDLLSTHNNLAESSLYLNLGYWRNASTYDQACQAMAEEVASYAEVADKGLNVLDVGCGFGDQDEFWQNRYPTCSFTAMNICESQIEKAKSRFPQSKVNFLTGSATALDFPDNHFDRIIALESAFHFDTREDFLKEAFRTLKPGGMICLADVVRKEIDLNWKMRLAVYLGQGLWQTPKKNDYSWDVYEQKMHSSGFRAISYNDISADVFKPFKLYAIDRVLDPNVEARINPILKKLWSMPHRGFEPGSYLLIKAVKPASL